MFTKDKLIESLKQSGKLSDMDLEKVLEIHRMKGGRLSSIIVEQNLMSEEDMTIFISEILDIPVLKISALRLDKKLVELIPKQMQNAYEVIPVAKKGKVLTLAMSDPFNLLALDDIREATGCFINPIITTSREIQRALESSSSGAAEMDQVLEEEQSSVEAALELLDEDDDEGAVVKMTSQEDENAPAIKILNLILKEALKKRCSDIHIEPYEKDLRVRYRIDGALHEMFHPPQAIFGGMMARLKILSNLDITERRVPQDGRFRIRIGRKEIDFRVSVLPMQYGEKAVLRILDKSKVGGGLSSLGFGPEPLEKFKEAIKKPFGMILVTGPTGSGKSTTLYSILNELNTPDRNLMTVEDPVEYQVEGISQSQTLADIGFTFASGLRALLRQSPDVILVGEIRDKETADIAVKAALTGHLVLSTLHTNNAAGAFIRLIDMGVEPFLVASSVVLVSAQRLIRKICDACREPYEILDSVYERIGVDPAIMKGVPVYHGKGCVKCTKTGYYGRIGVMEGLRVDTDIREMVLANKSTDEIQVVAQQKGMKTLFENSFDAFKKGWTTLEEVLRITSGE